MTGVQVSPTQSPTMQVVDPILQRRMDQVVKKINELTGERDQLVLQPREAGASLREIAAHAPA